MNLKEEFGHCSLISFFIYYIKTDGNDDILLQLLNNCLDRIGPHYPNVSGTKLNRLRAKNGRCLDKYQVK